MPTCLDKYLNCEIPDLPIGLDVVFLANVSGTTAKHLSERIVKQAFSQIKTDLLSQVRLKQKVYQVPSDLCHEVTVSDYWVKYKGDYIFSNYIVIPSPLNQEVDVLVETIDKEGNENTETITIRTNVKTAFEGVYTQVKLSFTGELLVYSDNYHCYNYCECSCASGGGIYLNAIEKCDIDDFLCSLDFHNALLYKYAQLALLEANFSKRSNLHSEEENKNLWLMDRYKEYYQKELNLLMKSMNTSDCFHCSDYNYFG